MSVSIIIPFYNASPFVENTLSSILQQTHTDLEVICVDDGSTDDTLSLLKLWQEKDDRVKIVHKENGGVESALKAGVEHISKKFTFLSGHDDTLAVDAIEKAYHEINRDAAIDAVRVKLVVIDGNGHIHNIMDDDRILTGFEALGETIMGWKIHNFCLWKTDIFIRIKDVSTGLMNFDELATRYLYTLCNKVSHCSGEYYYLQHQNSVTKKITPRLLDIYAIEHHIKTLLEKNNIYHLYKKRFENYMFARLQDMISLYFNLKKEGHQLSQKDINKVKLLYNSIDFGYLKKETSIIESIKYHLLYNFFPIFYYYNKRKHDT